MSDFEKCTSCKKDTNNGSFSCPVKMADGRSFGDSVYASRCENQYQMQFDKEFKSSFDYRQYLIENAEALMKHDRQNALHKIQS